MKSPLITLAIIAAAASVAHATPRCTDSQWHEALSSAPAPDGSILVAKPVLQVPVSNTYTVQVYIMMSNACATVVVPEGTGNRTMSMSPPHLETFTDRMVQKSLEYCGLRRYSYGMVQ
jgi:hypothetical protein